MKSPLGGLLVAGPCNVVGEVIGRHHRTALKVLCDCAARHGDLLIDAHGHRWRVVYTKMGRGLEGLGFECRLPPCLVNSIILVGLRPAAAADEVDLQPSTSESQEAP